MTTQSNLGEAEFCMEWVDWALPRDTGLELALLDRMQPWDFDDAGVFMPDLVEHQAALIALPVFYLEAHDGAEVGLAAGSDAGANAFPDGYGEFTQAIDALLGIS